jgi:hypothetical protein
VIVFAGIALDRVAAIRIPRPRLAWLTRLVAPPESGPGGLAEAAPDSPDVEGGRRKRSFPSRLPADWDIACLVLFIALALRLYFAFAAEAPINAREAAAAIRLAESGRLGSADAPIYPISLRGVHAVFGTGYRAIFVGQAILAEASLSYLGLGVQEPTPAWGLMLQGGAEEYASTAPWIAIFPGLAIALTVFGFSLFGDALRDAIDPKLRAR